METALGKKAAEIAGKWVSDGKVKRVEQNAQVVGGTGLAIYGMKKMLDRSWLGGAALALAGGYLMYHGGMKGKHFLDTLGITTDGDAEKVTIKKSVTVNRPLEEVFNYWSNFENLPNFMKHIDSVKITGKRVSHWVAKAAAGKRVEWDSEITELKENELIRWHSLAGSDVQNEGQVFFSKAPEGGTEVHIEFTYYPGTGPAGSRLAKFFNFVTAQYIQRDLRRFKRIMEGGEVSKVRRFERMLAQT